MNPNDPNLLLLESAVRALGLLCDRMIFVGGTTTGLLISDETRPSARATQDVDAIVQVASLTAYYELQDELRNLGFREDHEVVCRWRIGNLKLDVVPTQDVGLGFANRWYPLAAQRAAQQALPSGAVIRVITPALFIATKIEAFYGRGGGDYGASHDMEDIITVVDGRLELIDEVATADEDLRAYISEELDDLLAIPEFVDSIAWHLPGNPENQARVPEVIRRLRVIAGL